MSRDINRRVAEELARRAARRLQILRTERPELLAERMASLDPETLCEFLELTRLPAPLADREPAHRHVGIEGVDYCTDRLVVSGPASKGEVPAEDGEPDLSSVDDDDLLAARRYVPETLPGNVLG